MSEENSSNLSQVDTVVKRRKHAWRKLIIDGKIFHVYAKSGVPTSIERLKKFAGIEILPATREERQPYIGV